MTHDTILLQRLLLASKFDSYDSDMLFNVLKPSCFLQYANDHAVTVIKMGLSSWMGQQGLAMLQPSL